ncbi:uncharacterized protein LOC134540012 [Bacillus rossius redtenbacheri]|uniref:uncharacterized protein LOC134540012 n=1 Tax=Bacillus rossius redtenbacheri TaxID=93214 RepID=UPI002FDDC3A9
MDSDEDGYAMHFLEDTSWNRHIESSDGLHSQTSLSESRREVHPAVSSNSSDFLEGQINPLHDPHLISGVLLMLLLYLAVMLWRAQARSGGHTGTRVAAATQEVVEDQLQVRSVTTSQQKEAHVKPQDEIIPAYKSVDLTAALPLSSKQDDNLLQNTPRHGSEDVIPQKRSVSLTSQSNLDQVAFLDEMVPAPKSMALSAAVPQPSKQENNVQHKTPSASVEDELSEDRSAISTAEPSEMWVVFRDEVFPAPSSVGLVDTTPPRSGGEDVVVHRIPRYGDSLYYALAHQLGRARVGSPDHKQDTTILRAQVLQRLREDTPRYRELLLRSAEAREPRYSGLPSAEARLARYLADLDKFRFQPGDEVLQAAADVLAVDVHVLDEAGREQESFRSGAPGGAKDLVRVRRTSQAGGCHFDSVDLATPPSS